MFDRKPFNMEVYEDMIQNRLCFICEMVAGHLNENHLIYQDDIAIVFLNKYPVLYGYVIVAPLMHKEQVTTDFTIAEYLSLQRCVYQVAEAVRKSVITERIYILSLGSQQGNRHVHWHIAPLPYGVAFNQQQLYALSSENGILDIPDEQLQELALKIRRNMSELGQ